MERYSLVKYCYDLTDDKVVQFLSKRYKKYYSQRIEGHPSCICYLKNNLVFAKRVKEKMYIISVLAPSERVRNYWRTFPLQKLSRKIFDLFYKRKYILI